MSSLLRRGPRGLHHHLRNSIPLITAAGKIPTVVPTASVSPSVAQGKLGNQD